MRGFSFSLLSYLSFYLVLYAYNGHHTIPTHACTHLFNSHHSTISLFGKQDWVKEVSRPKYWPLSNTSSLLHTCPKWDSNLGQRRMAVFEDCQATTLTTQPPRLDWQPLIWIQFFCFLAFHYKKEACTMQTSTFF